MPPGPSRQWHAVLPFLARRLVVRRSVALRLNSSRRLSITAKVPHSSGQQSLRWHKTVVVSSQVDSITRAHFLRQVDRAPEFRTDQEPFAVFFVTPSFATLLLHDNQKFIKNALRKLLPHIRRDRTNDLLIHTLVAVVDRLPTPANPGKSYAEGTEAASSLRSPPFSKHGFEGMAYAIMDAKQLLPGHMELLREPVSSGLGHAPGTINIHVNSDMVSTSGTPIPHCIVQLPLANTIFHTGQPSTMFYSTWKKHKGESQLVLEKKEQLQHMSFVWPTLHSNGYHNASLTVPVTPITIPRRIEAGMGNIIRRIVGDNSQSVTASQELEETVPRYFAARNIPAHAMRVWALVIPKAAFFPISAEFFSRMFGDTRSAEKVFNLKMAFQGLWRNDWPVWNDAISFAMSRGARLHRVLSGGGGWGKKAGLLSLDPEVSYDESTPASQDKEMDMDMLEMFDVEESALKEVAKPGDFLQFFVSGPEDIATPNSEIEERLASSEISPLYLELGTIPSTIDHMPTTVQGSTTSAETVESAIHSFRGYFGALSEGGMSITREHKLPQTQDLVKVRSKIDVPFSKFTALEFDEKEEFHSPSELENEGTRIENPQKPMDKVSTLPQISNIPTTDSKQNPVHPKSNTFKLRIVPTGAMDLKDTMTSKPGRLRTSDSLSTKAPETPSDQVGLRRLPGTTGSLGVRVRTFPSVMEKMEKVPISYRWANPIISEKKNEKQSPSPPPQSKDAEKTPPTPPNPQGQSKPTSKQANAISVGGRFLLKKIPATKEFKTYLSGGNSTPNLDPVKVPENPVRLILGGFSELQKVGDLPVGKVPGKLELHSQALNIGSEESKLASHLKPGKDQENPVRYVPFTSQETSKVPKSPEPDIWPLDITYEKTERSVWSPRALKTSTAHRRQIPSELRIVYHKARPRIRIINSVVERPRKTLKHLAEMLSPVSSGTTNILGTEHRRGSVAAGIKPRSKRIVQDSVYPRVKQIKTTPRQREHVTSPLAIRKYVPKSDKRPLIRPRVAGESLTSKQHRANRRSSKVGLKRKVHEIVWSLVPEVVRGDVLGMVWKRVAKKLEAKLTDLDSRGESGSSSIETKPTITKLKRRSVNTKTKLVRAEGKPIIRSIHSPRPVTMRYQSPRSKDGMITEELRAERRARRALLVRRMLVSPSPRRVRSTSRSRMRKIRVMMPPREKRKIKDPEVAQLVDEVEGWLRDL